MEYSSEQHEAIDLALDRNNKLVGITGEAGSGKTTLIQPIYEGLDTGKNVCLCAPTGRAAKRITEATGIYAMTIHRMMRYTMPDDDDEHGLPAYDKFNKLPYDAIIVDEASMVNEDLYRAVIDALEAGSVIRFIGDANQLPPVEGQSPFLRLLDKFPSVRLTHNYRSGDGIITAARSIIRGHAPEANDKFQMINPGTGNLLPTAFEFIDDTFRGMNSQIIIPTRKGKYGTLAINHHLQQRLNRDSPGITLEWEDKFTHEKEKRHFKIGDKIIWTKNNYDLRLMNGQIGWVTEFDEHDGSITINIDGRDKLIPPIQEKYNPHTGRSVFSFDPRQQMELAYAVTTHKAQGSEFDRVLLLLNRSFVLNRANFYTAVTRAKNKVWCIFGPGGFRAAMKP